jgi:hypothetical protein
MKNIKILFIAADPTDATRLRLGEEFREIGEQLRIARSRERFVLEQPQLALRSRDITQALLDMKPHIVHYSGHGTVDGALYFEDKTGKAQLVSPDALGALFQQFTDHVECVVINACYSEMQAKTITTHIKYAVGMKQKITDKAAIAFSVGFYQALGAGRTIEEAFNLGVMQIQFECPNEYQIPTLITSDNVSSDTDLLIRKSESNLFTITQLEVNSFELGYLMLLLCVMPEDESLMLRTQNIINKIVGLNISPNEITCDDLPQVIQQKVFPKLAAENLKAAHWLMLSNNFFASMKAVDAEVRDFTSLNESTRALIVDNNLREEVSKKLILASDLNVSSHDSMNYLLDCMNIIRNSIIGKIVNN